MLTLNQQRQLKNRNAVLERRLQAINRENKQQKQRLEHNQHYIRKLQWEIKELKSKLFGGQQAETISDDQLQLALAELESERREQQEIENEVVGYTRRKKKDGASQPRIPEHLEVVREEIIPEEVQADPDAWEKIGEEVTEELDIEPTRFIRRLIVRPKYVRRGVVDRKPVIAKLPSRLIPRGIPSAGLLAFIIVSKYADHLPLYRLEKIFSQRYQVPVRRQRMCDWIGQVVDNWLSLIYRSIRQGLFKGDYLQMDETPIRYLDNERKGKSHKGYFWVFGKPKGNVCFDWQLGRSGAAAKSILKDFRGGLLQSDGYAVYDSVTTGTEIIQVGCWAHARRKFYKALQQEQLEAARYILLIRKLYAVEKLLPKDPEDILAMRSKESRPILDEIHEQLQRDRWVIRADSALGEAINYALSQWAKLTVYLEYPQTRIDNNLTEQSIRPCKLGAKNWLFIGHPDTGHRSAVIYTLIESCKRHDIEPQAYLTDILKKLPTMTNHEAVELTPDKWKDQAN